jgi:hypothetical protein
MAILAQPLKDKGNFFKPLLRGVLLVSDNQLCFLSQCVSLPAGVQSTYTCLERAQQAVGLPSPFYVFAHHGVALATHDPAKDMISRDGSKGSWFSWDTYEHVVKELGPRTQGFFFEVGTNLATVASRFVVEGVPVRSISSVRNHFQSVNLRPANVDVFPGRSMKSQTL